jgi:hypothetical protein
MEPDPKHIDIIQVPFCVDSNFTTILQKVTVTNHHMFEFKFNLTTVAEDLGIIALIQFDSIGIILFPQSLANNSG